MGSYTIKNTFTRGIANPLAWARSDIDLYGKVAEDIVNWHVLKEGGLTRRPGTRYRGTTKYADKTTRFVGFPFSLSQSYALEFGDLYVRPWLDYGNVLNAGSPVEVVSPYGEDDLPHLSWQRSNDVLYLARASKTVPPKKLKRTSHTSWSFSDIDFIDGPYLPINDQANALSTSGTLTTGASLTFTWANTTGLNGGQGILATDVGRSIRCQFGGKWSWGVITARLSSTTATVLVKEGNGFGGAGSESLDLGGALSIVVSVITTGTIEQGSANKNKYSSYSWRLGAFSETTGYPAFVTYYNGRLFWGRTDANPSAVWYSRSNYPEIMSPSDIDGTVTESHGGMLDISGAGELQWLQEAPRLQIGTPTAIRSVGPSNIDEAFGPRNVSQRLEIAQGTNAVRPAVVGPSSVHAGRAGKTANDLFFDFQVNSLVAPEISVTSGHLFKAGIKEIAFCQEPDKHLWLLLNDGALVSTTVERYEKVIGMTRHYLQDGTVTSICAVPGSERDDLYMIVTRNIDGAEVQYVETLSPLFDPDTMDKTDAFFVDCGGLYDGAETNTISGITWLAGEYVDILADGHALPRTQVSEFGVLTLPNSKVAEKIAFGKPINAYGRTMRMPTTLQDGSGLGRKCRVVDVTADVYFTLGLVFRSDMGQVDRLKPMYGTDPYISDIALMSGAHRLMIDGSWQSEGNVTFECPYPLPATIRALNIHLET